MAAAPCADGVPPNGGVFRQSDGILCHDLRGRYWKRSPKHPVPLQEKGTYLSGGAGGGYAGELYCSLLRAGKSGSPGHFEESTADPEPGSGLDCRGKALSREAGNLSGPPEERAGQSSILPVCDSGEAFLQHRGLHWLWPLCRALPPE